MNPIHEVEPEPMTHQNAASSSYRDVELNAMGGEFTDLQMSGILIDAVKAGDRRAASSW